MNLCSRVGVIVEVGRDVQRMLQRYGEDIVKDRQRKRAKDKGRGMSIGLGVPFDFNSKVVSRSEHFNKTTSIPPKIWAWRATTTV